MASDVIDNFSTWFTIGIPQVSRFLKNPTGPNLRRFVVFWPLRKKSPTWWKVRFSHFEFEQLLGLKTNNARSEDIWRLSPSPSCQKFFLVRGIRGWFMVAYPKNPPLVNSKIIWFICVCQELELGIVQHQPWTAVIIDSYLYLIGA